MMIFLYLFWFSIVLLAYTYFGFTMILIIGAYLFPKSYEQRDFLPSVTMLIAAYNEEEGIATKLDNIKQLNYPLEKLKVIIVSDGSEDRTNEIVSDYVDDTIQLLALPRTGKAGALNTAVQEATGDILVFSDANSIYASDAIKMLTRAFADPKVGGVAGDQRYVKVGANNESSGEQNYWNFDRYLKRQESMIGNVISATGAIYAIRRSLFHPIPEGVTDDFFVSTQVILQGYRLVFEENAIAYEPPAKTQSTEFSRKVRILTRGLNSVASNRGLLNPFKYGFYALQLFTHKVLRRLMYMPLLMLFVSNIFLVQEHLFYAVTMLLQLGFYGSALIVAILQKMQIKLPKIFYIPFYICMVYWAAYLASWNFLRGHRINQWATHR